MHITFEQHPFFIGLIACSALLIVFSIFKTGNNKIVSSQDHFDPVMLLHVLIVLLLLAAVCRPVYTAYSKKVNLMFCLDNSASVAQTSKDSAFAFIRSAASRMGAHDKAGLILFGRTPSIERMLQSKLVVNTEPSSVQTDATNIAQALLAAEHELNRQSGEKRIVLLSDGNETIDSSLNAGQSAAQSSIGIYSLPLACAVNDSDVSVRSVTTATVQRLFTPFEITVTIQSGRQVSGGMTLYKNGEIMLSNQYKIARGSTVLRFSDQLEKSGIYRYSVVFTAPGDRFAYNNEAVGFTTAMEKSKIALVEESHDESSILEKTLVVQGFQVERVLPERIAEDLYELAAYDCLILDNVPASALTYHSMTNIQRYVRDVGGGLIMIGGNKSFAAGHFMNTAVEAALPVSMNAPTDMHLSELVLVFVIDRSSSMSGGSLGRSKLDMARIAAFSSIELLNQTDKVGVIAFNVEPQWIVPITDAANRQLIADNLSLLVADGGTDLFSALKTAYIALRQYNAHTRHIIALTDGQTDEGDFEYLTRRMGAENISLSTVAVGGDADRKLLEQLARNSGGRFYVTDKPDSIPKIFTSETKLVAQNVIVEQKEKPAIARDHEVAAGIDLSNIPSISGHVVTYPKKNAVTVLTASDHPLLSVCRYGLGKSVAYTSDFTGAWGREIVQWDAFNRFVSQMVRWAQRKEGRNTVEARFTTTSTAIHGVVECRNKTGNYLNGLELKVRLFHASDTVDTTFSCVQTEPGRYQVMMPVDKSGDYYLSLFSGDSVSLPPRLFACSILQGQEFAASYPNYSLLQTLSTMTGGHLISFNSLGQELFQTRKQTKDQKRELWHYLVIIALIAFIGEILIRKIAMLNAAK
ncbi:MAG: VWA domain-containing protein [Chitinivibrionales bacterium]|nr:VWA domain-containing protein [Chitinivibrionales bacterium]